MRIACMVGVRRVIRRNSRVCLGNRGRWFWLSPTQTYAVDGPPYVFGQGSLRIDDRSGTLVTLYSSFGG
jgi:hypothetical protein